MSDINLTTRLPVHSKAINQVNIRNKGGSSLYQDVDIAPLSSKVLVEKTSSEGTGQYATLQDFLFAKFYDTEIAGQAKRVRAGKLIEVEEGDDIVAPDHYHVNVNATSIWQAWNDYQEILKKRLVGVYDEQDGYQGDYIQSAETDVIAFIIERYGLKDDYIPSNSATLISAEEQATQMLLNFNNMSIWQRTLDTCKRRKDALWGLYKDGELVGHFKDSRENIEALKDVYKQGVLIKVAGQGGVTTEVYGNSVSTDEEALNLLINLQEKSLFQYIVDLKNFWRTLAIEKYEKDSDTGSNIANKYDIEQLRTLWTNLYSDPAEPEYSDLEYVLSGDGQSYIVSGIGTCTDTDIVIPNTYNDLPVTEIGDYAFLDCDSLTSVTIPHSVTRIGSYALHSCDSLTSVTIGDSVTSIGDYAFAYCTSLTSVTIGDSVTSIGDWAFYGCEGLTSVTIPDSVTSIGTASFADCTNITEVTIGNSLTNINNSAFNSCTSLKEVIIGNSVTSIGAFAFKCCSELAVVEIGTAIEHIGSSAFEGCYQLTAIFIHNTRYIAGEPWGAINAQVYRNSQ